MPQSRSVIASVTNALCNFCPWKTKKKEKKIPSSATILNLRYLCVDMYAPYVSTLPISVEDWKMLKRLDNQSYKWDVLYGI